MALLEIKNLNFSYTEGKYSTLKNISFEVESGEICLIIGESGSGKSTLLRLLKKEVAPFGKTEGEISVKSQKIGFVNQDTESNIITDTVFGELAFTLENDGRDNNEISLKIAETASYFNLNSIINEKTENLSGGIKQLLSLASVMTAEPDLLLLDEPVSQLDPVSSQQFINTVLRLNKEQGTTLLISEHKIDDLLQVADKILVLDEGKGVFFGGPQQAVEYLINNNSKIKDMLPPYTLVLDSHPIEFAKAKQMSCKLKNKNCVVSSRNETVLSAKNISFAYKKNLPDVFFSLDYKAEKGKINAIIGANGSGKTTLLKCLSGILKCYSGKIKTKGKIAYLPQNVNTLFISDTVLQEIPSKDIRVKFALEELSSRNPFDLSGGEAQRLALAKIFSCNADIVLLDEPTQSMDAAFKNEFADMIKILCIEGKTIILVTHDLEFAGRYADNVSFLFDGKMAASAQRKDFFASLSVYTTALSRLTGGNVVSVDDAEVN